MQHKVTKRKVNQLPCWSICLIDDLGLLEITAVVNDLIQKNNGYSKEVKETLEKIAEDIKKSKKEDEDSKQERPETKMKENNYTSLSNKFRDILQQAQNVQMEIKKGVRDKIAHQAHLVDPNMSQEKINELCNDPEAAAKLMSQQMLGGAHSKLQNAVSDIQDKYREIQKLEQSVQLVFQMFQDLATLVHAQGEQLDSIEANIDSTKSYIDNTKTTLENNKVMHEEGKKVIFFPTTFVRSSAYARVLF